MHNDKWITRAARLICIAIIAAGIYLAFTYALEIIMPFTVAAIIALPLAALSGRCAKRFGGSVRAWRYFLLALTAAATVILVCMIAGAVADKVKGLIEYLGENAEEISGRLGRAVDILLALPSRIPALDNMEGVGDRIKEGALGALESILQQAGGAFGRALVGTPSALMSVLVTAVATVYITLDIEKIRDRIFAVMSPRGQMTVRGVLKSIIAYIRAYFKIFLLTFIELSVGLLILKRPYAILIAFCIALIDLLPLFGSGAVLGVWGGVLIATGGVTSGVGLLILAVIMMVVRQIIEPRVIGKSLGIHPLLTLTVMYAGFRAFGAAGMVVSPIGVVVLKETLERQIYEKGEKVEEKT